MRKRIIVAAILILVIGSLVFSLVLDSPARSPLRARNAIGVVYVEGTLMGGHSSSSLFGYVEGSNTVSSHLRSARNDDAIKAVVLRIDSPGGSAGAAQEVAREIEKLRSQGKKVVVSMGDVAASGGYWIASAADYIIANPGTITGSIGVAMHFMDYVELYQKIGISPETLKSGDYKDMGSPSRPLREDERLLLQGMIDDIYLQFIHQVAQGRAMPLDEVKLLADGRLFTGSQAKEEGLVDALGNFEDAIVSAAELAGLHTYTVVEYGRQSPLSRLLGAFTFRAQSPMIEDMEIYRSILRLPGF